MTEEDWLACERPSLILAQFGQNLSARKVRLFCCACCRQVSHLVRDPRWEGALSDLERYADGAAKEGERIRAAKVAFEPAPGVNGDSMDMLRAEVRHAARKTVTRDARGLGECAAAAVGYTDRRQFWPRRLEQEKRQAPLLRDVMGNPFRPARLNRRWLTPPVISLAAGIYEDTAFDRLPIFGDALEEAGCDNEDVLAHCRGDGPHVRGCWVVDLALGKD
jgi:hypothetical protein